MKTSLLVGFILFYALSVTAEATKGGLSKDEQKKLMDEINKDRRKVSPAFKDLTYDTELEKKVAAFKCDGEPPIWLQWNSVTQDFRKEVDHGHAPNFQLFNTRVEKIGCSKEVKCTKKIVKDPEIPEKFVGKEMVMLGGCFTNPIDNTADSLEKDFSLIEKEKKYGDVLGITLSSSARVFNLIVFLAIMVFYF